MNNTISKTYTGAKVIIETLKNLGVEKIFGYPGGVVLKIYDELYSQKDIEHILVRHEQAATHAAEGYARVTGKPGVVLVTSGPGATNTVTGIVNAYLDGFPLVVLTGQVFSDLIGKDAFQEADICDMTKSCTKKVFQVTHAKDLEDTLVEAFEVAMSGKKGPVVVDLAKNVLYENIEFKGLTSKTELKNEHIYIKHALKEICLAKHPVIVAGGGSVGASKELTAFAKALNLPVVSTLMGIGSYPQSDKNYLGMVGIFGDKSANELLKQSDLVLSVGARFNDRITCKFGDGELARKFIQIDINKKEISRVIPAYLRLEGDAKVVIADMLAEFQTGEYVLQADWANIQEFKDLNISRKPVGKQLNSYQVMQELQKFIENKDIVVTTEVGQHQLWAAQNLKFDKPLKFLTSGGSGTMGFGFPAAIGAAIANPSKPVVCVAGDGSFQMNMQELATCMDYNLPVKVLILNNGYLGMVRQLQQGQCDGRYSQTKISNPDFVKFAQSYGAKAIRVEKLEDVKSALEFAFDSKVPVIVDFIVEPMETL